MSKSDLRARPMFHRERDSIDAHLTIVFAALAVCRHIEKKADISIRRFVKTLMPFRTGLLSKAGKTYIINPKLTEEASNLLSFL